MSQQEHVQKLFAALGASIGFDDMGKDGQTMYRINYSDELSVNVEYMEDAQRILFAVPMLELPGVDNVDAYIDLLELNLYWDELAGGRFAMLGADKIVMFLRQIDVEDCPEELFVRRATAFINAATTWHDALTGKFADEDVDAEDGSSNGFLKV